MSIATAVGAAVDAYQKYKSQQDALDWQADVSAQLAAISAQTAAILADIQKLQEAIKQLPSQIDGLLLEVAKAHSGGWTAQAMAVAAAVRSAGHVTPQQISSLWVLVDTLAAHEGTIEAGWGYSAYCDTFHSYLARVGIYRILFHRAQGQQAAAEAAFMVAKSRKLAYLDAGIGGTESHNGPGRELEARLSFLRFARPIFEKLAEQTHGLRIGWFEYDSAGKLSHSGDPNNTHVKISQEKLVGTIQHGFSAPDPWGRDTNPLIGPSPIWPGYYIDNPWWPARSLNNYGTANFVDRCYGARNESLSALNNAVRDYWVHSDTVKKLDKIVGDLMNIRKHVERLTIS